MTLDAKSAVVVCLARPFRYLCQRFGSCNGLAEMKAIGHIWHGSRMAKVVAALCAGLACSFIAFLLHAFGCLGFHDHVESPASVLKL